MTRFAFLLSLICFVLSGCGSGLDRLTSASKSGPQFAVVYDGNQHTSGSLTDPSSPYLVGASVTVLGKSTIARTNFKFLGWNTESDGSGTDYNPGDSITMAAEQITLYAKWTPGFEVYYNSNGSTGGTAPVDSASAYVNGETVTVLGNPGALRKNLESFLGWNTAADGTGTAYVEGATFVISADVTLYAQYGRNNFYISTSGNDTTGLGTIASPYASLKKAVDELNTETTDGQYFISIAGGTYPVTETAEIPGHQSKNLVIRGGYNSTFTQRNLETILVDQRTTTGTHSILNLDYSIVNKPLEIDRVTFKAGVVNASADTFGYQLVRLTNPQQVKIFDSKFIASNARGGPLVGIYYELTGNCNGQEINIYRNHFDFENTYTSTEVYGILNPVVGIDSGANSNIGNNVFVMRSLSTIHKTSGIRMEDYSNRYLVRNNTFIFHGDSDTTHSSNAAAFYASAVKAKIENNLFYNSNSASGGGIAYAIYNTNDAADLSVFNNAFYGFQYLLFRHWNVLNNGYATAAAVNALGASFSDNFTPSDVVFTNRPAGDYTLADHPDNAETASNGLDGAALNWPSFMRNDKNGVLRTGDGTIGWSAGAFERDGIIQ